MSNNDIVQQLETVELPDISLEGYRGNLRSLLVNEHVRMYGEQAPARRFMNPTWRSVFVTSFAWVVILAAVIFGVLMPVFQPDSVEAKAIETVMASPEIQSILAGEKAKSVTVTDAGDNLLEVLVESHGGRYIIAKVRISHGKLRIAEISYIVLTGSMYEPDPPVPDTDLERVIQAGKTDPSFRQLIENGAEVADAVSIECLVTTRNLEKNETTGTTVTWAMVTLCHGDESCFFLIDYENYRVFGRGCRENPE